MKFLLSITLFVVLVAATTAATFHGIFEDPKHPGKCVKDGKVLEPGQVAPMEEGCGRMICGDNSEMDFHTCGVEQAPEGFYLGDLLNPTGPYPECCFRAYVPVSSSS